LGRILATGLAMDINTHRRKDNYNYMNRFYTTNTLR